VGAWSGFLSDDRAVDLNFGHESACIGLCNEYQPEREPRRLQCLVVKLLVRYSYRTNTTNDSPDAWPNEENAGLSDASEVLMRLDTEATSAKLDTA
jgi:hypothetical protein